jgi:hypothetical protein
VRVDPGLVTVGSRWRLRWPTGLEQTVTVTGVVNNPLFSGGFGVELGELGVFAFSVFEVAALERLDEDGGGAGS